MNDAPNSIALNRGAVEATLNEIMNKGQPMNDSGIHDFDVVGDQTPRKKALSIHLDASEVHKAIADLSNLMQNKEANRILRIKRLTPTAILPTRGSAQAIGLDLYADADMGPKGHVEIAAGFTRLIHTGIAMAIPPGYYGRVAPRSGLALKNNLDVLAGVVDADYRGEVGVVLHNCHPWETFYVTPGMRIAQIILERADILPVQEVDNLDDTARGEKGYGSSGV